MSGMTSHDLTGKRFGSLTAIRFISGGKHGKRKWVCVCDCGQERMNATNDLLAGLIQSCGCKSAGKIGASKRTHGHSLGGKSSRTLRIYTNMKSRCLNEKSSSYAHYGGRGVTICDEWLTSFESFLADMGEAPDGKSIDRKDVNGPYCKSNCKWSTQLEQMQNVRTNRNLMCRGELVSMSEAARRIGISTGTLFSRLKRGWDVDRALSRPASIAQDLNAMEQA